ncbi:hypothetical protein GCM10023321_43880 [Pseudonocardia eucalypti]|uniref:DUF7677 domain-containing protein n=1 Tax=Pseudonocardia eucalypti TaxID=648755 RepID=A0ABP9QFM9_9PSEU
MRLSESARGAVRDFAFAVADGALYVDQYGDLGDYRPALMEYGSALEMVFAIFVGRAPGAAYQPCACNRLSSGNSVPESSRGNWASWPTVSVSCSPTA